MNGIRVPAASSNAPPLERWPEGGLEQLGGCPLCGCPRRTVLHAGLRDRLFGAPGEWTLHHCDQCQCAYLDPRPTRASLHLAYRSYYTHDVRVDDDPQRPASGWLANLKQAALRGYLRGRFGKVRWHPVDTLGVLVWLRPRLRAAFNGAMRHLPVVEPGASLLDIGCGNGRFMAWARTAGWRCEGTEVDEAAAHRARAHGFPVFTGELQCLVDSGRRYDAVTLSHVIEHVHDPRALLQAARKLLKPGGFFWIETPNADAHGHRVFGADWRGLEPPRHLQLFTPDVLRDLMQEAGFTGIRFAPWQLDWAAMAGLSRSVSPVARRPGKLAQWIGEPDERVGRSDPMRREFITFVATAPVSAAGPDRSGDRAPGFRGTAGR